MTVKRVVLWFHRDLGRNWAVRIALACLCLGAALAAGVLHGAPVESDPATTNLGAWQAATFDPAKCLPVGVWDLVTDAPDQLANRRVRRINPYAAAVDAERPDRTIFASWSARFDAATGDVPRLVEWLRPGWLAPAATPTSERRPMILFWEPHGGYGDDRAGGNMDFFSASCAQAEGLDALADDFAECCRRYRALGVQLVKHDGSPEVGRRYSLRTPAEYRAQHAANLASGAAIGLDAIVATPKRLPLGVNEKTGDEYWASGQGCLMEGVPDPTDPRQAAWLAKPWPIVSTWGNARPRLFEQAEWAKGRWPAAGSPEFDRAYGGERWFVWCLEFSFSPKSKALFDAAWRDEAKARELAADWQERIATVRARCPRSICLVPNGLPQLWAKWGVAARDVGAP